MAPAERRRGRLPAVAWPNRGSRLEARPVGSGAGGRRAAPLWAIVLIAGAIAMLLPTLWADPHESSAQTNERDLERLFWDCDFAATRVAVDAATGAACATVTDEMLRRRFQGDFKEFIHWWQANKEAQRAAHAAASVARAGAR
jgi:hypothetical protein